MALPRIVADEKCMNATMSDHRKYLCFRYSKDATLCTKCTFGLKNGRIDAARTDREISSSIFGVT